MELGDIAQGCWSPSPQDRPPFPTVLEKLTAFGSLRKGGTPCRLREPNRKYRPPASSAVTRLRHITDKPLTSSQAITRMLADAFAAKDYLTCVKSLKSVDIDPQEYIDGLEQVRSRSVISSTTRSWGLEYQAIDILSPESDMYNLCVRELSRVCGIYELLPESHKINSILTMGQHTVARSGYSNLWRAMNKSGEHFAVRVLRIHQRGVTQVKQVGPST